MAVSIDTPKGLETPEVMKRRLRAALRRAREGAGLTQKAAADALFWSSSKIIRIEQGNVPVTPTDVRALLTLYEVTDEDSITELVELAKDSRNPDPWAEYKDLFTQASLGLFGSEPAAKVIYKYEPTLVPGLFQTADYARALLKALGNSADEVEQKLQARLKRQQILERNVRPELAFIMGEATLSRPVGGDRVMLDQIEWLKTLATRPGISLQILSFAKGPHRGLGGAFTILQFDDENLPDLLYLEDPDHETTTRDDANQIKKHLELFVELQALASTPEELPTLLDEIATYRFTKS